jgi:hypothetical protein
LKSPVLGDISISNLQIFSQDLMKLLRSGEVDEAIKCLAGQNPYGEPKNSWDLWMFIPQSIQTWF